MPYLVNGEQASEANVRQLLQESGWSNDAKKEEIISEVDKGHTFVFGTDRPGEGSMFPPGLPDTSGKVDNPHSKIVIIKKADQ